MTYNIDSDLRNSDWVKTRSWSLPTDPEEFLDSIGGSGNLPHFMSLPAAEAMPNELRTALWLPPKNPQKA